MKFCFSVSSKYPKNMVCFPTCVCACALSIIVNNYMLVAINDNSAYQTIPECCQLAVTTTQWPMIDI